MNENEKSVEVAAPKHKLRRGFACMSVERRAEVARAGGRKAHQVGSAHEFSSAEARNAGRKGGLRVSEYREYMRALGRKGGRARSATPRS